MIKVFLIGHLGRDAEVNVHGSESVVNFSLAHTDKYKDGNGVLVNKPTWISCSWWVERATIAQYMKQGTQVFVEGTVEAKMWRTREGENKCGLNCRVYSVQLLGGKKEDGGSNTQQNNSPTNAGYKPPVASDISEPDEDLPF